MTHEEVATRAEILEHLVDDKILCFTVEVDHYIAAEDHIKELGEAELFGQIESLKGNDVAQFWDDTHLVIGRVFTLEQIFAAHLLGYWLNVAM